MPYPPDPLETDATNETALEDEHPQRHNDTATAVNDLVTELGTNPSGASADVTTRLSALDATVAAKETPAGAQAKVDTHTADTTAVHGIADTTALIVEGDSRLTNARTPSGSAGGVLSGTYPNPAFAADMATQAELDAVATAKANASHSHVVGDLPATLATDAEVTTAVGTHEAASDPHPGYLTTAEGNAAYEASGAVATHTADTTSVHGIADTADLVLDDDGRLSDDRTPTAHTIDGAKHTASGLTSGHVLRATGATTFAFGALQDGDIPASIARDSELPDLSGHVAAADPHAGYRLESVAITAADVAADVATQAELDAHLNDTTDAHDATAISFAPAGTIAATNVQAAIEEVAAEAGGGGVSDGDKGDITVSASGATWTVDNNAITLAKLADIATARIVGRVTASSGDPEELTAAQVKTLLALTSTDLSDVTAFVRTLLDDADAAAARNTLVVAAPVRATDTVTVHQVNLQSVTGSAYATIFDVTSGGLTLLGGAIYAVAAGFRLTIDGTVVMNVTAASSGRDSGSDAHGVIALPMARADTSMKLEAYNAGSTRDFGWIAYSRVAG